MSRAGKRRRPGMLLFPSPQYSRNRLFARPAADQIAVPPSGNFTPQPTIHKDRNHVGQGFVAGLVTVPVTNATVGRSAGRRNMTAMAASKLSAAEPDVYQATLAERDPKTPQVNTEEVRQILADGSAILLDSRKRAEFEAGHIAGACNVAPPPGATPAEYVAAVERFVRGDKNRPLVIYCNGQYCRQGRQLSAQLVESGFTNVKRYQLGIPVWRALSLPVEIELEGILRIFGTDRTVVYFDARSPGDFAQGTIPRASNVPADEIEAGALAKAPLPRTDFNTRIVIFGRDGAQARKLADAMSRTPFQNVSYFPGNFVQLAAALKDKSSQ
jgi:rhodanese-related sulfurtransferase